LIEEAQSLHGDNPAPADAAACAAMRGLLALSDGRWEEAAAALQRAGDLFQAEGDTLGSARTSLLLAEAYLRLNQLDAALVQVEPAAGLLQRPYGVKLLQHEASLAPGAVAYGAEYSSNGAAFRKLLRKAPAETVQGSAKR